MTKYVHIPTFTTLYDLFHHQLCIILTYHVQFQTITVKKIQRYLGYYSLPYT